MEDERKTEAELIAELEVRRQRAEGPESPAPYGERSEAELDRHVATFEGLREIAKAISGAADTKELFDSAAALLGDTPGAVAGAIYLLDEEAGCLRLEKSFGRHPSLYENRPTLALDAPDVKSIMWAGTGVSVDGLLGEESWRELLPEESRSRGGVAAAVIGAGSDALGVLTMILETVDVYAVSFVEMAAAELGSTVKRKRAEAELATYRRRLEEQVEARTEELRAANERLEGEVAERKRALAELAESEESFRKLAEDFRDAIVVYDAERDRLAYSNPSAAEMFGISRHDFHQLGFQAFVERFVHEEDRASVLEAYAKAEAARNAGSVESMEIEFRVVGGDGEPRWVRQRSCPVVADGAPTSKVQVILSDVTERKRAEDELQESAEKYRAIARQAPFGVVIHRDGDLLYANEAVREIVKVPPDEDIDGLSIFDFVLPEEKEGVLRVMQERERGADPFPHEVKVRSRNGEIRVVETVGSLFDYGGETAYMVTLNDITERKRAEEALRDSEARYRTLQGNVPVGVFRTEVEAGGKLISVNPALVKMFGYGDAEEMYELDVADLYVSPEEFKAFVRTVKEAGAVSSYEVEFKRRGGTAFWGSLSARAVEGPAGGVAYFDGILEDITGRKEAEQALAESEEKYRTLVESATDGVVIVQDGLIKFVNPALVELAGYDAAEDVMGMGFLPLVAPEFRELLAEKHRSTMAGVGTPLLFEVSILNRDGEKVPVELNTAVIQYEGRPAAIATVRDLTERKRAQRRITYFSEFAKNIIESAQVGIYTVDRKGTLQIWNRGMESRFGVRADEVVGRNLFEVFPSLSEEALGAAIKKALIEGVSSERSGLRHRTLKKGERILNAKINPMRGPAGEVVGAVVVTDDVTERARVAERMRYFSEFTENIIESTQVGIYAVDKNGVVQIWNRGMEDQFGVAAAELVGKKIFDAFPALRAESLGEAIIAALERGESFDERRLRHRTLKRGERVLNTKINPLRDPSGRLVGAVVITEDVTERVAFEEKLGVSEARYRTLTANVPVGVFRSPAEVGGTLLSVNPALAKMFGYAGPEEMHEVRVVDLYADPEERKEFIAAVSSAGAVSDYEARFRRKDGTVFWGSLTARAVAAADGKVACFDGILEDIAQRKEAEKALAESEAKYRTFVEQATDGVAIAQDGVFKFANRALANMLGCETGEELAGKSIDAFIVPAYKKTVAEKHGRTMSGEGDPSIFEAAVLNKDGEEVPVEVNGGVITFEGRPASMAIVRDIRDRKRAELDLARSLRRNEALLQAMPDMMFVLNKDGDFTDFKADRDEDLALPPDEILGKNVRDIGLPDYSVKSIFSALDKVFTEGESRTVEYELDMSEGPRVYEARIVPLDRDEGLSVVRDITERKVAFDKVKKSLNGTIYAMSKMVETRDPYTSGHQLRVAQLARAIAEEMALPEYQVEGVFLAAVVHDVGKISIPEGILSKPGPLTDLELSIIKNHPQVGYDILKKVEYAKPITRFVLQHHERLDGSGYPLGLKGSDIAVEARILSVADVVEAMSSHRPFRPALGQEKALEEISSYRGVLYDTDVVDVCLKLFCEGDFRFN